MNIWLFALLCLGCSAVTRTFVLISLLGTVSVPSTYTLTIADVSLRGQVSSLFTLNACFVYSFYGSLDKNNFYMTRDKPSFTACDLPLISLAQVEEAWAKAFLFSFVNNTLTFYTPDNMTLMVYSKSTAPVFSVVGLWNVVGGDGVSNMSVTIDNTTINGWSSSYSYDFKQPMIKVSRVDQQKLCGSSAGVFCTAMDGTVGVKVYSLKHWCFWSRNNQCLLELSAV